MTDYDILFKKITRLCAEMVAAGASSTAVPLEMNYLCNEYGFRESEFIVNANGVLATAIAPDGTNLTAIRAMDEVGNHFGKLRKFDDYYEVVMKTLPSAEEIDREIEKINGVNYSSLGKECIASIFLGTGFAALFGCAPPDLLVAASASVLIALISRFIKRFFTNLFFTHTVVCLIVESVILLSNKYLGICERPESVSLGVIMLLISGLSFSDGLWSMLNKETTIGVYKLNNALIGALGIVIGVAMPLALIDDVVISGLSIKAPIWLQVIECILACGGFAVLCCTAKKDVPIAALGAGLAWLVYAVSAKFIPSTFTTMAIATFAVTIYALIFAVKKGLNANITRAVGVLPLVPGSNLFYMLSGFISQNSEMMGAEAKKLITTCLGISFGLTLGLLFLNIKDMKLKGNASK